MSFREHNAKELADRRAAERTLLTRGETFTVEAWCWFCSGFREMAVDFDGAYPVDGIVYPNWREKLCCPTCGLNGRLRSTLHFAEENLAPSEGSAVYLMERTSPVYQWFTHRCPATVGSEFLGDEIPFGTADARGIRNESASRLTFEDERFDIVVSLDVIEHIPSYRRALSECARVLRDGGRLLLSAPFAVGDAGNLQRARRLEDGTVQHLLPPEYHGDPIRSEGCLAYHRFGWALLEDLLRSGFREARAFTYWSMEFGYLGDGMLLVVASR
jgi:SAM-dependent methyltransferase